jgi:hypothetical protein
MHKESGSFAGLFHIARVTTRTRRTSPMFSSFWMGGFESACHINVRGERLDMIAGVQHDKKVRCDYSMLRYLGFLTVRDGARWHLIDRGATYDFSSFLPMVEAAAEGTQVIWNLCHYGWPDDIDVLSPEFVNRFARFSGATASVIREESDEVPFYTPINEISFLSWAASRDVIFPFAAGKDNELKQQLVRATIAACEAIWQVDPRARFVYPEPSIHVVAPFNNPSLTWEAQAYNESQYEAWDMIAGSKMPWLGGHQKYLDIIGMNYYHSSQWEIQDGGLRWEDEPRDQRWLPFRELINATWERYRRPLVISETSHFGAGRARWIIEISQEVAGALDSGIPVEGICLYPILDRFDWEDPAHWHNSGLFDLRRDDSGGLVRVVNCEYAEALAEAQASRTWPSDYSVA